MAERIYKNNTVENSLNGLKGCVNWANTESVAEYFYKLSKIAKELTKRSEEAKAILLERKETIFFPEFEDKVYFQEGSDITEFQADKCGEYLIEEGRQKDLLKVISITEKALKELSDSAFLIAKFKVNTGESKADSVGVKKMTKDELKEIKG